LISVANGGQWMREGPDDRVRHDEIVERIWRFEVERVVRPAKVRAEQFVERGVAPRLLIAPEPPEPVRTLGSQKRLVSALNRWRICCGASEGGPRQAK
jgi:hypothetical protein